MDERYERYTENDWIFEGYDTDQVLQDVLEPGRYKFKVLDVKPVTSKSGRKCARVVLELSTNAGTVRRFDTICLERRYDWRWRQFLFAIGIRRKGEFKLTREEIIGREGWADIVQKERSIAGGVKVVDSIRAYYPTDGVVKMANVPPENNEVSEVSEVKEVTKVEKVSEVKEISETEEIEEAKGTTETTETTEETEETEKVEETEGIEGEIEDLSDEI